MDEDPLKNVKRQLRDVQKTADDTARQCGVVTTRLTSLSEQIIALDRKVRIAEGRDPVDLDHWPELTEDVVRRTSDHFALKVKPNRIAAQKVEDAKTAMATYLAEFNKAVRAARRCGRVGLLGWVLRNPAANWDKFVVPAQKGRPIERLQQAELEHAEYKRAQAALRDQRTAAEQAVTTVRQVVLARLEPALERELTTPQWFHTALGSNLPRENNGWLDTAVDLVVYRIAFGVTSRLYTFEKQISSAAQREEHDRLKKECDRHRTA